jgi:hypothetical protein
VLPKAVHRVRHQGRKHGPGAGSLHMLQRNSDLGSAPGNETTARVEWGELPAWQVVKHVKSVVIESS